MLTLTENKPRSNHGVSSLEYMTHTAYIAGEGLDSNLSPSSVAGRIMPARNDPLFWGL